jgi:hypothetical protein
MTKTTAAARPRRAASFGAATGVWSSAFVARSVWSGTTSGSRLSHEDLVRAVRALDGISAEAEYPGFSDDPAAGFRHLRADLDRFGDVFLTGGAKAFRALKKWLDKHPKKSGLAGLGP